MTDFPPLLIGALLTSYLLVGPLAPAGETGSPTARLRTLGPASAGLIAVAAPLAWCLEAGLLGPLQGQDLRLFLHVPLLAALAWCGAALWRRWRPEAAPAVAPLWLNGAGLGAMQGALDRPDLPAALGLGLVAGLGFWLASRLLADLLERLSQADVPGPLRGAPSVLVAAGLLGLAFLGLEGFAP